MPRALVLGLVVMALGACGPKTRYYPGLADRWRYACCTLHFNKRLYASDANYSYAPDPLVVPAGTPVWVTGDDRDEVHLLPNGQSQSLELAFKFGKSRMSADQYFRNVLLESDPRGTLPNPPGDLAGAIREGRLLVGMTKAQAITARGYPPFHRTDGTESDVWTYYDNPDQVDVVQFVEGKVATVTRTDAPTR